MKEHQTKNVSSSKNYIPILRKIKICSSSYYSDNKLFTQNPDTTSILKTYSFDSLFAVKCSTAFIHEYADNK